MVMTLAEISICILHFDSPTFKINRPIYTHFERGCLQPTVILWMYVHAYPRACSGHKGHI